MKDPRENIAAIFSPSLLLGFLLIVVTLIPATVTAQNNLPIPQGSLIIAMDNERQGFANGSCAGPQFNLRAYGYAVRLLHQNVKLLWVVNSAKTLNTQNDIDDINVTQISGQNCAAYGPGTAVDFRGGPLVITPEYAASAKSLLTSYNSAQSTANQIRVFEVQSSSFSVPVSSVTELTHRPFVAVGPDCPSGGGCLPSGVYERLYAAAGLQANIHYAPVSDETFGNFCVTLAAQAHAQESAITYRQDYQDHVASGGNMLLQCRSVALFEQPSANLFFTTSGIDANTNSGTPSGFSTNTVNPQIHFNQYVGNLGRPTGYTNFELDDGNWQDTVFAAERADDDDRKIAMVRDTTANTVGGIVMGLGGHEYGGYPGDIIGTVSGLEVSNGVYERVNGSRMALNALLIPAQPACSFTPPSLAGYKTVKLGLDPGDDVDSDGVIEVQDTVEWTVRYINTGNTDISDYQITDEIDSRLELQAGSLSASTQADSAAVLVPVSVNPGFDGTSNLNMLGAGITLNEGAMITVRFKTKVLIAADIPNQASASGNGVQTPVATDSADANTTGSVDGYLIAGDCANSPTCFNQSPWVQGSPDEWTAAIEPTYISVSTVTTAAGVEIGGMVLDAYGRGLARESIRLQNAETGELRSVSTNTFGYFRFRDVPLGGFYILSVRSRRYSYQNESIAINLVDNISGVRFVASPRGASQSTGSVAPVKKSMAVDDLGGGQRSVVSTSPARSAGLQRRTIVVKPTSKKVSKEDEELDEN